MSSSPRDIHVAVIGGGLVGSLLTCLLGQRNIKVTLFESRNDIRQMEVVPGRSINLALSERGRAGLRAVGLEEAIVGAHAIPMYGRLIHDLDGRRRPIPYDTRGRAIYSISRRFLNETLLTAAERYPNVKLNFEHKLTWCNVETGELRFNGGELTSKFDLVVGCDGAHSAVRHQMLKRPQFNYQQEYISHGYIELSIPPTAEDEFAMEQNFLHIWARGTFMMIALPNQDRSYTVTLIMPLTWFRDLNTRELLLDFFSRHFPDAFELIGRDRLVEAFFSTPPSHFISIKCFPYHAGGRTVIVGDAAHAQVPFFGQGMNAGFEDCIIFDEILERNSFNLEKSLDEYSNYRNPDLEAICDLSMYNYKEMRDLVNSRRFLFKKRIDYFLHRLFPSQWIPLYIMVTFTRMRYKECVRKSKRQDKILSWALWSLILTAVLLCSWAVGARRKSTEFQPIYKVLLLIDAWVPRSDRSLTDWISAPLWRRPVNNWLKIN